MTLSPLRGVLCFGSIEFFYYLSSRLKIFNRACHHHQSLFFVHLRFDGTVFIASSSDNIVVGTLFLFKLTRYLQRLQST